MLSHIAISLLLLQLHAAVVPNGNADPLKDRYEEIDMLLWNGALTFGLVTGRIYPDHYCVLVSSLKERMGYNVNKTDKACISLDEIESGFEIPLLLDKANMRLQLPLDFNFPAKAYSEALARANRSTDVVTGFLWTSPTYKPSTWINTKRFDLMLQHSGNEKIMPDVQSAIGGNILGGTFDVRGLAVNNRRENSYVIHSLDYLWILKPTMHRSWITSVELGSRLNDVDRKHSLNGLKLTNKPLSSRESTITERLIVNAAEGSIVEWDSPLGGVGHRIFDGTGSITLDAPLKYGMNKISYHLTEPGALTRQHEVWIRVPTKLIPKRKLEYELLFGLSDVDNNSRISYSKVEYGVGNRLTVGVHQTAVNSKKNGMKSQFGTDIVLRPTFTTEFQGNVNSDLGYSLYATYWNPKLATIELSDNRVNSSYGTPLRFDRRSSLVRVSLHRTKVVRTQASYLRTTYGFGSNSLLNSTLMSNTHRWNIATNIGYQWWKNYGEISMGLLRTSGHVSHRIGPYHMLSADVNATVRDRADLESIKFSSFYNASSIQIGANVAFHFPVQSLSAGFTARIRSDWFNAHMLHEATNQGHQSSHFLSTSWMKSDFTDWHAASQTSRRSSGLILIPYLDMNQNGVRDGNETEMIGLIGKINEGRVVDSKKSRGKLMFAELQPNREYQITLSPDLRNDPEYVVSRTRLTVDTPGSGYREIYIPVSKSFELTGLWENESGFAVQPGRTRIILRQIDGEMIVQGTLFGDGTWFVDKLGHGTYEVSISDSRHLELVAYPRRLFITSDPVVTAPKITIHSKT